MSDLADGLSVVPVLDRVQARPSCTCAVPGIVIDESGLRRVNAQAPARQGVDSRVGLAQADLVSHAGELPWL